MRLLNPKLLLEFTGRMLAGLSSGASMGLEATIPGTIVILPHASLGVTGVLSCPPTTLLGDAYFRRDIKLLLTFAGMVLLVTGVVSFEAGMGCCAVYSREYAARSLAICRYVLTSVMARLTGRTEGLASSSSVAPSRYPGVLLVRRDVDVRPTRDDEFV